MQLLDADDDLPEPLQCQLDIESAFPRLEQGKKHLKSERPGDIDGFVIKDVVEAAVIAVLGDNADLRSPTRSLEFDYVYR